MFIESIIAIKLHFDDVIIIGFARMTVETNIYFKIFYIF